MLGQVHTYCTWYYKFSLLSWFMKLINEVIVFSGRVYFQYFWGRFLAETSSQSSIVLFATFSKIIADLHVFQSNKKIQGNIIKWYFLKCCFVAMFVQWRLSVVWSFTSRVCTWSGSYALILRFQLYFQAFAWLNDSYSWDGKFSPRWLESTMTLTAFNLF